MLIGKVVGTVVASAAKKRRQMSPTAPASRSWSWSACARALPLSRSSGDGSREPIPTSTVVSDGQRSITAVTVGSATRVSRAEALPSMPGAGMKIGLAPVFAAKRPMRRVASIWTLGSPTPPTTWTTLSTTVARASSWALRISPTMIAH